MQRPETDTRGVSVLNKAELDPGLPLAKEEKAELEELRTVAEPEVVEPVEIEAGAGRIEMEIKRKFINETHEMP